MTVQGGRQDGRGRLVGGPALTLRVWAVHGKCALVPAALLQRGAGCAVTEHHTPRPRYPRPRATETALGP